MRRDLFIAMLVVLHAFAGVGASLAEGEQAEKKAPETQAETTGKTLTVAVLDFVAKSPGEPDLGAQIGEALTVMLSGESGFQLVDRATLSKTLEEQELSLSGVVATEQAVKVGQIVGARILVIGKAFPMGKQMFITAKLVGTETSLVEGVLVKGALDADIGELVVELAVKVAERLGEAGARLAGDKDAGRDPLPELKKVLSQRKKPIVAVIIPERHLSSSQQAPDPAVETEMKKLLLECGFQVQDVKQNDLADFAKNYSRYEPEAWPRSLAGVDVVIVGEGLSEYAARIGNLVSCAARAEINVLSRKDGRVLMAERTTQRGVDLAENIAAKNALQKAGRSLGLTVLKHFAETLPADEAVKDVSPEGKP